MATSISWKWWANIDRGEHIWKYKHHTHHTHKEDDLNVELADWLAGWLVGWWCFAWLTVADYGLVWGANADNIAI